MCEQIEGTIYFIKVMQKGLSIFINLDLISSSLSLLHQLSGHQNTGKSRSYQLTE